MFKKDEQRLLELIELWQAERSKSSLHDRMAWNDVVKHVDNVTWRASGEVVAMFGGERARIG